MAKITQKMVDELNKKLETCGVGFRYMLGDEETRAPKITVTVLDPVGFTHPQFGCVINLSDEFYDWLNNWFKTQYDITLDYNNTKSIAWSDDYS